MGRAGDISRDSDREMTGQLITLRYLGSTRTVYRGAKTRRQYAWNRNGDTQAVTTSDAAALLLLRRKSGKCCGGPRTDAGPLFEEVGDNIGQIAGKSATEE